MGLAFYFLKNAFPPVPCRSKTGLRVVLLPGVRRDDPAARLLLQVALLPAPEVDLRPVVLLDVLPALRRWK